MEDTIRITVIATGFEEQVRTDEEKTDPIAHGRLFDEENMPSFMKKKVAVDYKEITRKPEQRAIIPISMTTGMTCQPFCENRRTDRRRMLKREDLLFVLLKKGTGSALLSKEEACIFHSFFGGVLLRNFLMCIARCWARAGQWQASR